MKMLFISESDFLEFKDELRRRLSERQVRECENDGHKPSAVKILIMNKNNAPHVLLTRRTDKVNTHKGQVSFPGGGFDETDGDILGTAYRETFEEVGIQRGDIEYLGKFDDYISLYGFHISCFVGAIEYPREYHLNSDEIDACFEAPLSMFVNEEYESVEKYYYQGRDYDVFYYNHDNFVIWGLTARILTDFARKVLKD